MLNISSFIGLNYGRRYFRVLSEPPVEIAYVVSVGEPCVSYKGRGAKTFRWRFILGLICFGQDRTLLGVAVGVVNVLQPQFSTSFEEF